MVGRRRGDGVLDDDDTIASSLEAQGRLRDAHVRLQADQYQRDRRAHAPATASTAARMSGCP